MKKTITTILAALVLILIITVAVKAETNHQITSDLKVCQDNHNYIVIKTINTTARFYIRDSKELVSTLKHAKIWARISCSYGSDISDVLYKTKTMSKVMYRTIGRAKAHFFYVYNIKIEFQSFNNGQTPMVFFYIKTKNEANFDKAITVLNLEEIDKLINILNN